MTFKIGKFEITVQEFLLSDRLKFSVDVSYSDKDLNGALYVSFWQGSENPLVIKSEVKTGELPHA